jgi:hypothetical protein
MTLASGADYPLWCVHWQLNTLQPIAWELGQDSPDIYVFQMFKDKQFIGQY